MSFTHEAAWIVVDSNNMFRSRHDTQAEALAAADGYVFNNPDCQVFMVMPATKVIQDGTGQE